LNKGIYVIRIQNEELTDIEVVIEFIKGIINIRMAQIIDNKQNNPPSLIACLPAGRFKRTER